MTPFGLRLRQSLDTEVTRMRNEWFHKWHYIGSENGVQIDAFDGRAISYGGIKYAGSARDVYWDTLKRYIAQQVDKAFEKAEHELENYPPPLKIELISETASLVSSFCNQISHWAIEKDRVLRGDGVKFPPPDLHAGEEILRKEEVNERESALRRLVGADKDPGTAKGASNSRVLLESSGEMGSFRDFKKDLLVAIAVLAKAETNKIVEPIEAAKTRALKSRGGWLAQAVEALDAEGLINATMYIDGKIDARLTGDGLERAEELCDEVGSDLYDEIEEQAPLTKEHDDLLGVVVPASDRVVRLDHNAPEYREVVSGLDVIIADTRSSNSLSEFNDIEKRQRIAELEAGKRLMDAPQVDIGMIKRVLLGALKWVVQNVGSAAAKVAAEKLIMLLVKNLS